MTQNFDRDLNKIDWSNFLKTGAILRVSADHFLIWQGPFQIAKDEVFSIGYANFFGGSVQLFKAGCGPFQLNLNQLLLGLDRISSSSSIGIKRADFLAPSRDLFEISFQSIMGKIQRQEIEKAVPVVVSSTEKRPEAQDLCHWIRSLAKTAESLKVYGFWDGGSGIIGATPEVLFEQKEGLVKTMALAGTKPISAEGLLTDKKEVHEHQVVVRDLEQRLETIGWVRKSEMKVLQLPHLQHLLTELTVEGGRKSPTDLIRLLHPTPALGVAPRAYGYQWLQELGPQSDREKMGGPILYALPGGENLALVAIRNIQWSKSGSKVFAGCGLVKESQIESEWEEVNYKLDSIFKSIGLAE